MINASILKRCGLLLMVGAIAAGCAGKPDRYKQPPPRNTQALPGAQGVVYGRAPATLANPTDRCITSAGHCPLPAPTETGLPCTCDAKGGEYTYGGSTGPIPPMPEWADPRLKHAN